jgi:hypothetical protein
MKKRIVRQFGHLQELYRDAGQQNIQLYSELSDHAAVRSISQNYFLCGAAAQSGLRSPNS